MFSSSTSTSFATGRGVTTTSTITYTTIVAPTKEGDFELEPATIKVGIAELKSNKLTIKVLPPDQRSQTQQQGGGGQQSGDRTSTGANISNEDVFLRAIVSNRNVYEQESLTVTFKLYCALEWNGYKNLNFPEFEGFLVQDVDLKNPQWQLEHYNGRNYNTAILKQSVLYPQRSGQLTIGSAKIESEIRVRVQSRGRSVFDDFFSSGFEPVTKESVSQPVTIQVKPLPTGKPASFSGAVGQNFSLNSEINRTTLKVNEAITVKLTIKGNGNIKVAKSPEVKFPNDFEIYDPKTQVSAQSKTIEYMAIPRFAGDFEIPPVSFSYFDTQSETYKTLSTEGYTLHVERGEGSGGDTPPVMSNYNQQENVKILGKDIRYIKVNDVHFVSTKEIFFGSFLYVMSYLMIAILFIVFFIIYRKQMKENANIALVRTKKANKVAVKRLKQAEKLLKENREEAFYEEVLRALWGYLSDKLNIPQAALTKENVATELAKSGVDETLSNEFLEIINTCEFARYAPVRTSGAMDKLFAETIEAIGKMENSIKTN